MADIVGIYYQKLLELMLTGSGKIRVPSKFHDQVKAIDVLLKNDKTAIVSTIYEYMVQSASVDINFTSTNEKVNNLFFDLDKNLNSNVNIDIPRGIRSFTEQYFRERWKSSFIVLNIRWKEVDGYIIPYRMWFMDGASIHAKNEKKLLNTNDYYYGRPKDKKVNIIENSPTTSILIRKPYNQWYDLYPTPYFIKKGTLYHALFKERIIEKQAEFLDSAFPYQLLIKAGSDEAMKTRQMPTEEDLKKLQKNYKNKKENIDEHTFTKGLVGAFPYDVNFEELIPNYVKVLDEKIIKSTDKNLASSLGLIELRGFSTNREESILNPKVLIEEIEDAVLDYAELWDDVIYLMKQKNEKKHRNTVKTIITVEPGIIRGFITDEMRTMIRSWYDRGIVAKESALENTTPLQFERQIRLRDEEKNKKLNYRLYPPVTQNMEKDVNDPSKPSPEDTPTDKKKKTPESKNYKNACDEIELIVKKMKSIKDIPKEIRKELSKEQATVFKNKFNEQFAKCTELKMDDYLREKTSMTYAIEAVKK